MVPALDDRGRTSWPGSAGLSAGSPLAADLEHSARELREKIVPASDIAGLDLLDARAAELAGAAETITGLLAASHAWPAGRVGAGLGAVAPGRAEPGPALRPRPGMSLHPRREHHGRGREPRMTARRQQELDLVLEILGRAPGASAYFVSLQLPPAAAPEHLLPGAPEPCATTGEALALLRELERAGLARSVPDPHGAHWYPVRSPRPI